MTDADIAKVHRIDKAQVDPRSNFSRIQAAPAKSKFLNRPTDDHHLPIFDPKVRGHTDQYAAEVREAA